MLVFVIKFVFEDRVQKSDGGVRLFSDRRPEGFAEEIAKEML